MIYYNKRVWLDKRTNTHSSSNIHCYYDLNNSNETFRSFVKINDCASSYYCFLDNGPYKGIMRLRSIVKGLMEIKQKALAYIEKPDKAEFETLTTSFYIGKARQRHKFEFSICHERVQLRIYVRKLSKRKNGEIVYKYSQAVHLHADPETCTPKVFIAKQSVLIEELNKFIIYLKTL